MDELQQADLTESGKFNVKTFADKVAIMSAENVRRILRKGPNQYPDSWKKWGVVAYKPGKRDYVIEMGSPGPPGAQAGDDLATQLTNSVEQLDQLVGQMKTKLNDTTPRVPRLGRLLQKAPTDKPTVLVSELGQSIYTDEEGNTWEVISSD